MLASSQPRFMQILQVSSSASKGSITQTNWTQSPRTSRGYMEQNSKAYYLFLFIQCGEGERRRVAFQDPCRLSAGGHVALAVSTAPVALMLSSSFFGTVLTFVQPAGIWGNSSRALRRGKLRCPKCFSVRPR